MTPWKPAILNMKPFGREYDREFTVESRSGSGKYTLNLYTYTCTCPDFVQRRVERPLGDVGRSCKHLRDAVLALDIDSFGDELTRVIFKSPHGPYERIWFAPGPDDEIIALGIIENKPWLNLFIRRGVGQPYDRYGYSPSEGRWSYDSIPPAARDIVRLMAELPGGLPR